MLTSAIVLLVAALLTAAIAFWALNAYRRAGGGARSAWPALAACAAVGVAALAVYLVIGRPALADGPYQARLDALIAAFEAGNPPPITPDEQLALWTHFARQHPEHATPHLEAAKVLLSLGRPREAAGEYDQALRRDPESGEALLGMGRAIVEIEGRMTPEALAFFAQAGSRSADPAPWLYQAMAAMEAGRDSDAHRLWREALARMGPDDPRRAMAQSQLR